MTVGEAARLIGERVMFMGDEAMVFLVRVVDVKQAYGSTRFLVTPEAGAGERWVDAQNIRFFSTMEAVA